MTSALLKQIKHYQTWGDSSAAHRWTLNDISHRKAILDRLRTGPAAFDRHFYQPGQITGSAWVVAEDTGRVALVYHRRLKRWLQPGGHAEAGELDGISTALRETREELGLAIEPGQASLLDLDVHCIPETASQPSHLHFDIRYLCRTQQQPLAPASDVVEAKWFTVAEFETMNLEDGMQRMLIKGMKQVGIG
jgi:8-oxo-dGTP pyrophosphatase MutT (NUDIX family)